MVPWMGHLAATKNVRESVDVLASTRVSEHEMHVVASWIPLEPQLVTRHPY